MRILIADKLAPQGAAFLQAQDDTEVTVQTGLAGDDLAEALRTHDGMVVRSAVKVTGPVLDRCADRPGWRLRARRARSSSRRARLWAPRRARVSASCSRLAPSCSERSPSLTRRVALLSNAM